MDEKLKKIFYLFSSALLLLLSFPRFNAWFLSYFALIPLFKFIDISKNKKEAFGGGFLSGFIFYAALLRWLPESIVKFGGLSFIFSLLPSILTYIILSLFTATFTLSCHILRKKFNWRYIFLTPFVWTATEFLRAKIAFTGFPWCPLGNTQVFFPYMIQVADLLGVYGVSFFVVLINGTLYFILSEKIDKKIKRRVAIASLAIIINLFLYAELRYFTYPYKSGREIHVGIAQGNIPDDVEQREVEKIHLEVYPDLMGKIKEEDKKVSLIILPEGPTTFSYERNPLYREFMKELAEKNKSAIIFNSIHYKKDGYYNSIYSLDKNGNLVAIYDKIKLVPFAEYVPLKKLFFFVNSMTDEVSNFKCGKKYVLHDIDGTKYGGFICYESIFPKIAINFVRKGANVLLNLTNDNWFSGSDAPYQHFNHIILRAVETRRWIVRVANGGISAIIDPFGRITKITPFGHRTFATGKIYSLKYWTPYQYIGDTFSYLSILIVFLFLFMARGVEEEIPPPH